MLKASKRDYRALPLLDIAVISSLELVAEDIRAAVPHIMS
jgi:hypothetical protein